MKPKIITGVLLTILIAVLPLVGMNTVGATDRASLQWGTRYYMSRMNKMLLMGHA
jgi:hypothetical protein